jgi:signal transduction histidine kinase
LISESRRGVIFSLSVDRVNKTREEQLDVPPTIDSLGLGAAIQSYTRDWGERTGTHMTLNLDMKLSRLPEATELSIFRIVQEGLNNV